MKTNGAEKKDDLVLAENAGIAESDKEIDSVNYSKKRDLLNDTKILIQAWSVLEIYQKHQSGNLILNPSFQRGVIWKADKKTAFIESLFMDIRIPPIYVVEVPGENMLEQNKYEVVDGKQRLTAIVRFLNGQDKLIDTSLEYFRDIFGNKYYNEIFKENPSNIRRFLSSVVDIYVITANSPEFTKYDIFARLNKGSAPLQVNELRRAIYKSSVTDFINRYSEELKEKNSKYSDLFTKNSIKRYKDLGRFYRSIAFYLRADFVKGEIEGYNARPRDMINTILQEIQCNKILIDQNDVKNIIDKTVDLLVLFEDFQFNKDFLVDACIPFRNKTIEDFANCKDVIVKDSIILSTFQKSPGTTTNINLRFKRIEDLLENV